MGKAHKPINKVTPKMIHTNFIKEINERISALKEERNSSITGKTYFLTRIEAHKYYIDNFTKLDYSKIGDLNRNVPEHIFIPGKGVEEAKENVQRIIAVIVNINKRLIRIEKEIESNEKLKVKSKSFRDVLQKFNEKVSDAILDKGYNFDLGYGIFRIRIKKLVRKVKPRKKVDWELSWAKKNEIIARGGTPYKILEKDADGKVIKDNGGERWIEFSHRMVNYVWSWEKYRCCIMNKSFYSFKPFTNSNLKTSVLGNANRLHLMIRTNDERLKNFL